MSELIFYCEVHNLLIGLPFSGQEQKLNYLNERLGYLCEFFRNNNALYEYYQEKETAMDIKLFVRKPVDRFTFRDFPLNVDPVYFYGDKLFSTGFDFLFAQFAAFEKLQLFLEAKMKDIMVGNDIDEQDPIKFTGTGGDFVELVNIFKAVGGPVDTETGNPASEEQLAEFLKNALNADWGNAEDFQTLKIISNASNLPERMLDNMEELRKKWAEEDEDIKYD